MVSSSRGQQQGYGSKAMTRTSKPTVSSKASKASKPQDNKASEGASWTWW